MEWHIICRIGENDSYMRDLSGSNIKHLILHFSGGATNQQVREHVIAMIEEELVAELPGSVHDLVYAAMSAYLSDLCIPRRTSEDRWSRKLVVHLPVFEPELWRGAGQCLQTALEFLTGDSWSFSLRNRQAEPPSRSVSELGEQAEHVCLLSGGLDSLVGAIDLLIEGKRVAFVSHHGGGMTAKFQNDTFGELSRYFLKQCRDYQFFVVGPHLDGDSEHTMRSRSILFIALGIAVASAIGDNAALNIPENGLISLNVPMTGPRISSSSTRTTHPHFIACIRQVLTHLRISNSILMPYKHFTKGEMLSNVADSKALSQILSKSMSCSHPEVGRWSGKTPGIHCGYCFPCIIRRAAVNAACLQKVDSAYETDVERQQLAGDKNSDLLAVRTALERRRCDGGPDIFRVLESGPISSEEVSEYVDVYSRGMAELGSFLGVDGV